MSQKINSNALFLGNRLAWNSVWCENSSNFASVFHSDLNERSNSFGFVNLFSNNQTLKRVNGISFSYNCFTNHRYFFKSVTASDSCLTHTKVSSKMITPVHGNVCWMNYYKEHSKNALLSLSFINQKTYNFIISSIPFLASKMVADFIAYQILIAFKLKEKAFKQGVLQGIILLSKNILSRSNFLYVSGILVKIKGKWIRTRTGRKQAIMFSVGQLTSEQKGTVSFGSSDFYTKFGSCNVKVWICFRAR